MRIDSHQHFWIYNSTDYVWMSDAMGVLRRDFLPSDLEPLLADVGFDGSIAVQARQMELETQWLLELAAESKSIVGVVGWVDFSSPQLDQSLERFASDAKFKGVRELIHDVPDIDYAMSDVHTRAISKLDRFDLTYDLLLRPEHFPSALQLVRKFPNQRFVVDHIAKPNIKAHQFQPWEAGIRAFADCDNVCCKLSGMVTEVDWNDWRASAFWPYLDVVVEAFGTERVMIGSDWPVCTLSSSYRMAMDVVLNYIAGYSSHEIDRILGGNATEFYRLQQVLQAARASDR